MENSKPANAEEDINNNNVVVTDNSTYKAITTIDLSLITTGVTQAMLNSAVRTNGAILISSAINSNIYNILVKNLHDSDEVEFEHASNNNPFTKPRMCGAFFYLICEAKILLCIIG